MLHVASMLEFKFSARVMLKMFPGLRISFRQHASRQERMRSTRLKGLLLQEPDSRRKHRARGKGRGGARCTLNRLNQDVY